MDMRSLIDLVVTGQITSIETIPDRPANETRFGLLPLLESRLNEKAPPGEKAERFIRKHKKEFKKRYGDKWEEVLYATAWRMFG